MSRRVIGTGTGGPLQARSARRSQNAKVVGMGTTTLSWLHRPSQNRLGAPLWLFGILAVSVLLFWKLAEDVAGREWIVSFDRGVAASLHAQAPGLATSAFTAVTHLGSALVLVPMTVVAMLALIRSHRRAQAVVMGVALAGGEALNTALKLAFERQRPSFADSLGTAAGFSFPSGHAMVSLVVYGALAYYVSAAIRARWAKVLVVLSGLGLILAIGFSRIYLGVHYPSDVLAGYSAGLAWLMVCALTMLGVSRRGGRPAEGDRFRPTTQLHRADPPARAVTRGIRSRRPSPM